MRMFDVISGEWVVKSAGAERERAVRVRLLACAVRVL